MRLCRPLSQNSVGHELPGTPPLRTRYPNLAFRPEFTQEPMDLRAAKLGKRVLKFSYCRSSKVLQMLHDQGLLLLPTKPSLLSIDTAPAHKRVVAATQEQFPATMALNNAFFKKQGHPSCKSGRNGNTAAHMVENDEV